MNKPFLIVIVIVIVVGVGGVLLLQGKPPAPQEPQQQTEITPPTEESNKVLYSDAGYAPKELRIKQGETVTFTNESSIAMWPASAIHPTHTLYPGSSLLKCGTPQEQGIFDACQDIGPGKAWSFRFNEKGSWKYHDHRIPTRNGTIIVE